MRMIDPLGFKQEDVLEAKRNENTVIMSCNDDT